MKPETPVTPSRGWRLKTYFALLVALFCVAAAAASIYVFVQTDRDSRKAAERDASFAATTAARQLGEGVSTIRSTVAGLAATPGIDQAAEQKSCTLSFALEGLSRGHLDVLRPDGSVSCSSRPRSGAVPRTGYEGAPWLQALGAKPLLRAPVEDAATGAQSILYAARTPGGGAVAAFVALGPVGRALADLYGAGRPVEFLVTTADRKTVLARSHGSQRWVGKQLTGSAFAQSSGTERRDVDGTERFYRETTVPGVGWHFFVGEDRAAALAAGSRLRERQLAIILLGLTLVLLATWIVYRRVAVPITKLGAAVRSSSAQTPPAPVPVGGPAEVADLGANVNGLIEAVALELSRRREAEESSLLSARSYRELFESSPLPMWIHDAGTLDILEVNEAAVGRYGYTRDELLMLKATDIARPEPESEPPGLETHVAKDGLRLVVRALAHDVMFDGRRARCVVTEDIGERERLEGQLRQAQKMEAIGQLAGGIAHDFNNLLTVISGFGAMARQRIGAGPGGRELAEVDRAAKRAAQLTKQLLTFSRQQVLDTVVLDLNEVIEPLMPMLFRLIGEDIEIGVLSDDETPHVLADRGQLEQVLVNLVLNARDAMPDGGTLTIETRSERLNGDAPAFLESEPGLYACLLVTDTGVGIDADTRAHLFEPFFTTKAVGEGTGLGLATVHGIVTQSGGHVVVDSEPGLGTTFKVYLPAAAGVAELRPHRPEERPGDLAGTETVLVCEDDGSVRAFVEAALTEAGYKVLATARADEAVEVARSEDGPVDVLLTDVVMPQMSGPELAAVVEQLRPGVKVIFLSGYAADTGRGRGWELPAEASFLQKPFSDVELLSAVRGVLAPTT
ncbi:MAG: ATP-binding protein [Solirubrobacteraceae bacterium]